MASIYKKQNSPFWFIQFIDAEGKRRNKSTGLRTDTPAQTVKARALRAQLEAKELNRDASETSGGGWDTWVPQYLERHCQTSRTLERYTGFWSWLAVWLQECRYGSPRAITYRNALEYIQWRTHHKKKTGKTVGRNTAIMELKFLAMIMGEAVRLGYPSHLKLEQSRQMPYFAMVDRLRVFLRSDQCVLLTCGYSFGDEHINAYIAQGLSGNPNAACFAMIFNDRANAPKAVELAKRHANLTLLATDGAVVGTVERDWHSEVKDDNPAYAMAVATDLPEWRTKAPADRCKWLLGDFAALGRFLGHQLSSRDVEQGVIDAR